MLHFPSNWIPKVFLDKDEVERAVGLYRWGSANGTFEWVRKDHLIIVGSYLVHYYATHYWKLILDGGVRGYSLYLHEFIELQWYAAHKLNPFKADVQIRHYSQAHSQALLVEHRFLQIVAQTMGFDFSLRELILNNPHGDPPQRDWDDTRKYCERELSHTDASLDQGEDETQVQEFFRRLGFGKVV